MNEAFEGLALGFVQVVRTSIRGFAFCFAFAHIGYVRTLSSDFTGGSKERITQVGVLGVMF